MRVPHSQESRRDLAAFAFTEHEPLTGSSIAWSWLALAIGVLAFSTSGVLAKLCEAPATAIAFWVRAFSLAYIVILFVLRKPRRTGSLLLAAGKHGLAGGFSFALHILCYFSALKLTSVAVVFIIGALNPAVIGIFGMVLLGEQLTTRQILWTVIAISAAACVILAKDTLGSTPFLGNFVALLAAAFYCVYFLISREARRTIGVTEYMAVVTAVSLVVVGVLAGGTGAPLAISGRDVWWIALLALVPATLGHLSVNWALRHVHAHAAATILLAAPLFAGVWAYLFIDERLTIMQIASGMTVLVAIPGAIRGDSTDDRVEPG